MLCISLLTKTPFWAGGNGVRSFEEDFVSLRGRNVICDMNAVGNIFWLLLGGIVIALMYYLVGLLMCVTIIGIPFGVQLFKLGTYALWPFGHELVDGPNEPGCVSVVMNLIWILAGWWEIALMHLAFGLLFCVTIVGIPFGIRHFRMAIASIFPFGKEIR